MYDVNDVLDVCDTSDVLDVCDTSDVDEK